MQLGLQRNILCAFIAWSSKLKLRQRRNQVHMLMNLKCWLVHLALLCYLSSALLHTFGEQRILGQKSALWLSNAFVSTQNTLVHLVLCNVMDRVIMNTLALCLVWFLYRGLSFFGCAQFYLNIVVHLLCGSLFCWLVGLFVVSWSHCFFLETQSFQHSLRIAWPLFFANFIRFDNSNVFILHLRISFSKPNISLFVCWYVWCLFFD